METLRLAWRLVALILWTTYVYGSLAGGAFLIGLGRGGWLTPRTARWRTGWFRKWSRGVLRILGIRSEIRGEPPDGPFYLVSNHLSYIDIVVIGAQAPCVFVAKAEVAGWPIFGTLCRGADTLFIDRGNKRDIPRVIRGIRSILDTRRGVVVFPEGSSTKGESVLRFRPSLLESAASAGLPVSYAAVSYRTPAGGRPAHEAVCWWGDAPFMGHLMGLLRLSRIEATLEFGDEPVVDADRKELARRLQDAVEQVFQPVV